MNRFHFEKLADLAQARVALAELRPHLPWPRLSEMMNCNGVILPGIGDDHNLPVLEQPETLVGSIPASEYRKLPQSWQPAVCYHKQRLRRNTQWVRLYPECVKSSGNVPLGWNNAVDGVVAGALLLAVRPLANPLRSALMRRAITQWWGQYLAAQGLLFAEEAGTLLVGISNDPRLAAALWRENPDLGEPLAPLAMSRSDLWSATIALEQPLAAEWLGRICALAASSSIAACTALPHAN